MALIPTSEISILRNASFLKDVANGAEAIHEKESVARLLNSAANTGAHSAKWLKPMSDSLKKELESLGYTVTKNTNAANSEVQYIIEGF